MPFLSSTSLNAPCCAGAAAPRRAMPAASATLPRAPARASRAHATGAKSTGSRTARASSAHASHRAASRLYFRYADSAFP